MTTQTQPDVIVHIVNEITTLAQLTIEKQGRFHMVFPGGTSPWPIFSSLRETNLPWEKIILYPSDERCVPIHTPTRNDFMIDELLIRPRLLPKDNLIRIPAETNPVAAAKHYHKLLRQVSYFDLVLLGIGADGHTASIFPNYPESPDNAYPVFDAPKKPSTRITISANCLRRSQHRWALAFGTEKKPIMLSIQQGATLPITRIQPTRYFWDF